MHIFFWNCVTVHPFIRLLSSHFPKSKEIFTSATSLYFYFLKCSWRQKKTMHSLISIVGMVLTSKENYKEWYRKIKSTLIFNDLWKGICEAKAVPQSNKTTEEDAELEEEAESEEEASMLKTKSSRPCKKTSHTDHRQRTWNMGRQRPKGICSNLYDNKWGGEPSYCFYQWFLWCLEKIEWIIWHSLWAWTRTTNIEALQPRVEEWWPYGFTS